MSTSGRMKSCIRTRMKTRSLPGNWTLAKAKPASVVMKNWPTSTTVTSRNVLRKYLNQGAPAQAMRKLSSVQGDATLKFTASDVVWKAAQKAKNRGEIQIRTKRRDRKRTRLNSHHSCTSRMTY